MLNIANCDPGKIVTIPDNFAATKCNLKLGTVKTATISNKSQYPTTSVHLHFAFPEFAGNRVAASSSCQRDRTTSGGTSHSTRTPLGPAGVSASGPHRSRAEGTTSPSWCPARRERPHLRRTRGLRRRRRSSARRRASFRSRAPSCRGCRLAASISSRDKVVGRGTDFIRSLNILDIWSNRLSFIISGQFCHESFYVSCFLLPQCPPMFSDACRVDLRLNGLSFGQGDDCGSEDYVEVDGIPFCDAEDVTSLREKLTKRYYLPNECSPQKDNYFQGILKKLFSDEVFFLPDRNSVSVRQISEGSDNSLFQSLPWSIDYIQVEC